MRIKYMGTADIKQFLPGDDFGGRLATPLDRMIQFTWDNNHIINTDDPYFAGGNEDQPRPLSDEFWEFLLAVDESLLDVTGMTILPVSEGEKLWRGIKDPAELAKSVPAQPIQALITHDPHEPLNSTNV